MRTDHPRQISEVLAMAAAVAAALLCPFRCPAQDVWRFDCGTPDSPVMDGHQRLTHADRYSAARGYGWESEAESLEFARPQPDPQLRGSWGQLLLAEAYDNHRDDLNRDAVIGRQDLTFRLDVPPGSYRVSVTLGDLSVALGSIDVFLNDRLVADQIAVWAPGGYRMLDRTPAGWWRVIRATGDSRDGAIRVALRKNQAQYDEQMAEQATWENPYRQWYHRVPVIQDPPYHFIGYPFEHHSIMAIEVQPYTPPPVVEQDGLLRLAGPLDSPALGESIAKYNAGDFAAALQALDGADEPEAEVPAAIVRLWLAGRLETEIERTTVPVATAVLRTYVAENPDDYAVAEILGDAEIFLRALDLHLTRGDLGKNHFLENDKAIGWWWMLQEGSPLYWKTQLHIARAAHMLKPYVPTLGTEREIFKRLAEESPDNRFVKYHLSQEWANHGDGSAYYDWLMRDYEAKAADAPEWVRAIYPAYAWLVDLSEWWVNFRQLPEGTIGGGWGDDVELVGLFGYYGYISRGVSDTCIEGTRNLVDGVWNLSEVDPTIGYCLPMADAEHSAEWTGNTLGMMAQIDYGNPVWIERSMMAGKLIRDLWTDYNDRGHRHFRANFLGAAQVGAGDRRNDSWINYRAVSPASAVLRYNGNPAIAELYVELAEAWLAAAMSTDRGKPKGVIPAEVSFPEGVSGGVNSPNWWTASHPPGTVNHDWQHQQYKGYLVDVLMLAYQQTGDARFLEPLRLEYELAVEHGHEPQPSGARGRGARRADAENGGLEPGSEAWAAAKLTGTEAWLDAERMIQGRQGALESTRTKAEIIETGREISAHLKTRWPLMTSEAGPTDRVAFVGIVFPFFVYTGGSMGGPLLRAAVTYENTTKDFAAAVLGADTQGLRIIYYSLARSALCPGSWSPVAGMSCVWASTEMEMTR